MFTGLVDDVGTLERVADGPAGRELLVRCRYEGLVPGESVAVNGVCLTVRECGPGFFTAAAVVTSLGRTAIGEWEAGRRVNLERAMRLGDRLGGHIVQGHVDGVGVVRGVRREGDAVLIDVDVPPEIAELLVPHGSVTVDGVSLTVNALPAPGVLQLSIIDFTLRHTTLGLLAAGDRVHLEADVIGKFVRRLVAPYLEGVAGSAAERTAGAVLADSSRDA
ncbi:MAG TPA: riboflavin synthase [Gemmatimonadales bacterium]